LPIDTLPEPDYLSHMSTTIENAAKTQRRLLGPEAVLNGEQVLPGFQYPLADLFKEWEW